MTTVTTSGPILQALWQFLLQALTAEDRADLPRHGRVTIEIQDGRPMIGEITAKHKPVRTRGE